MRNDSRNAEMLLREDKMKAVSVFVVTMRNDSRNAGNGEQNSGNCHITIIENATRNAR